MTNDEIQNYIKNLTWDKVKDLPHDNNRISYINISGEKYDAYLYVVIINSNKKTHKYFGYEKSTHFIVSYTGTPVTHIDEYSQDLLNYEYRIICLAIGEERQIRIKEGDMLDIVKKDEEFYNEGSSTFLKGYAPHKAVKRIIKEVPNIKEITLPAKEWQNMERFQTRLVPEEPGLVAKLKLLDEDSKGKYFRDNHKGVVALEDYHGKGKHLRYGSYHTIEMAVGSKYTKELKGKLIPKNVWKGIDILGIEYLADADNKRNDEDARVTTSTEKALDWCMRVMDTYKVHHTDDMIKEYLSDCGFRNAEMQKTFWPKLRVWTDEKKRVSDVPVGHQLVDYHKTKAGQQRVLDKKEEWESDSCHCLILGTSYFHNDWEGIPEIVFDLSNDELLKKKFWKIFTFHKNSDAKENWPQRLVIIEKWLTDLIDKFSDENKIIFDIESLPYSSPKETLLDDKKAA